jgi:hypothetical protein
MLSKSLMAVLLVLSAVLAGCKIDPPPTPKPAISLSASGMSVQVGQTNGQLRVSLTRTNYTGEITVEAQSETSGISVASQKTMADTVTLPVAISGSVSKGDHPLTIKASGQGLDSAEKQVMLTVSDTTPTPLPSLPVISGQIQGWPETTSDVVFAYSDQGETLGQASVNRDGKLELTLNTPARQADLDTTLNQGGGFCEGNSNIVSTPQDLQGAFVATLANSDLSIEVREHSFPPNGQILDGVVWVFRVYSTKPGSMSGSCQLSGSLLNVNAQLVEGWNIVVATYKASNNSYSLEAVQDVPSTAKLWAYVTPKNEPPVATLYAVAAAYDQVYLDVSSSYDPDGSITSYSLDFGDGYSITRYPGDALSGYYQYASSGYYTITLTVYDDSGGSSTSSQQVYIYY